MLKQSPQREPRGFVRDTTSQWARSQAAQRSIPGREVVPVPGGGERDARASYQYTCSLHTLHLGCRTRDDCRKKTHKHLVTRLKTRCQHNLFLFVWIPFHWRPSGHTEGFLQVELSCGDWVCWLRQTDAAISEELKAARGAGLLNTNTRVIRDHVQVQNVMGCLRLCWMITLKLSFCNCWTYIFIVTQTERSSPEWWVLWMDSPSPPSQWPWGIWSCADRGPTSPAPGPCWKVEWRVVCSRLEPPCSLQCGTETDGDWPFFTSF